MLLSAINVSAAIHLHQKKKSIKKVIMHRVEKIISDVINRENLLLWRIFFSWTENMQTVSFALMADVFDGFASQVADS